MYRLITIAFSHYNEKARWGLERFGRQYRESGYMPLFHFAPVAWETRNAKDASVDKISTKFSTPVLVCPDGERICDSSRILRHLDAHFRGDQPSLYAPEDSTELEESFHHGLGAHSRRLAYYYMLDDDELMKFVADKNVGWTQAHLFRMALPLGRALLKKNLKINAEAAARSRLRVIEAFDEISERLSDGRPFLCGDAFSAADLTFASLSTPSLLITKAEGNGAYFPSMDQVAAPARALAEQLRESPAGQHALRMYAEERTAVVNSGGSRLS